MSIISLEAKAIPKRIAAHPQALERSGIRQGWGIYPTLRGKTEPGKNHYKPHPASPILQTDKAPFLFQNGANHFPCRIIRRAKENQFGVFVGSRQQFIGRELEVIIQ